MGDWAGGKRGEGGRMGVLLCFLFCFGEGVGVLLVVWGGGLPKGKSGANEKEHGGADWHGRVCVGGGAAGASRQGSSLTRVPQRKRPQGALRGP